MARSSSDGKKRVKFEIKAESGKKVFVAGTLNEWKSNDKAMKEKGKSGVYSTTVLLPKGRCEYKFIIDGVWCVDPECPEWVPNNHGTLNSVISVE